MRKPSHGHPAQTQIHQTNLPCWSVWVSLENRRTAVDIWLQARGRNCDQGPRQPNLIAGARCTMMLQVAI